jgi:hypothetical protein
MRHASAGGGARVYLDPRSSRGRRLVYTAAPPEAGECLEAGECVLVAVWERRKKPTRLTQNGRWKALPYSKSLPRSKSLPCHPLCSSAGTPLAHV